MKKNIFKKAACMAGAVVITLAMTTSFLGCSSDSEETVPTVQEKPESFKDALRSLADAQRESCQILFGAMQTRAGSLGFREDPDSVAIAAAIARADSILTAAFGSTLSTIDLTADLTSVQINALNITPREAELYAADPYAFLDYANTAKSPEFCKIYGNILNGTGSVPTVENVISNNNLTMNEQITMVVSAVCEAELATMTDLEMVFVGNNKCKKEYALNHARCYAKFVGGNALAVLSMYIFGSGVPKFVANTVSLFDCIVTIKNQYDECRNGNN